MAKDKHIMGPARMYWSEEDSVPAVAVAVGVKKRNGKLEWIWKKVKQNSKMKKKRKIWQKAQAKAEKRGDWSCRTNPFEEHRRKQSKKRKEKK